MNKKELTHMERHLLDIADTIFEELQPKPNVFEAIVYDFQDEIGDEDATKRTVAIESNYDIALLKLIRELDVIYGAQNWGFNNGIQITHNDAKRGGATVLGRISSRYEEPSD